MSLLHCECYHHLDPHDHPYWHGTDRRYSKLSPDQLEASRAESLKSAAQRIMPFFNSVIVPSLKDGNRCLVVSHANTLRTLIKQIDNLNKKIMAIIEHNNKNIHFGAKMYEYYTTHKNEARTKTYLARHKQDVRIVLRNESTL